MNKKQWIKKISEMRANGSGFCELKWSGKDWERWNEGNPTRDQQAMIEACNTMNVEPRPGELSPDTISFH